MFHERRAIPSIRLHALLHEGLKLEGCVYRRIAFLIQTGRNSWAKFLGKNGSENYYLGLENVEKRME